MSDTSIAAIQATQRKRCQTIEARPYISVVLTAYGRPQYVAEALESVVNQDIGPGQMELIVVSDLANLESKDEIASLVSNHGVPVRFVYIDHGAIGKSHFAALSAARGELIAFLNDDDLWESTRAGYIVDLFRTHPSLGFVHNSQSLIRPDGLPIAPFSYQLLVHPSTLFNHKDRIISSDDACSNHVILTIYEADFNTSSIAIRRCILEAWMHELPEMTVMDDSFYLYSAVASGCSIMLSSKRLTRYRLHSSNMSYHADDDRTARLSSAASLTSRHLKGIRRMERLMAARGRHEVVRLLKRDELYAELVNHIQNKLLSRRQTMGLLLPFVSSPRELLAWKNAVIAIASLFRVLSPSAVTRFYSSI